MSEPISRSALAGLVVDLTRELSAVRQAYHVCLALLAEREGELRAQRTRYEQLLEEYRRMRAGLVRRPAA